MMPPYFPFLVVMIFVQATAFADGGTVQWRKEARSLVITVFASPVPLSAGPVDVSLLLQRRNGLEPVLDANVWLLFRTGASGGKVRVHATRDQAQNKLLYAAPLTLTESGKWNLDVTILQHGEQTSAKGIIDVAAPEKAASHWGCIAFPPLMIVIYVVRERLIRRKPRV